MRFGDRALLHARGYKELGLSGNGVCLPLHPQQGRRQVGDHQMEDLHSLY